MTNEKNILLEVATMFYKQGLSQYEIANRLYFSPSKVSRLMKQAIEEKIVEIHINYPTERSGLLEEQLRQNFNAEKVYVLRLPGVEEETAFHNFGKFAAPFVAEAISDNCKIGVSSGRTIRYTIQALGTLVRRNVEIIQLKGMANQENKLDNDCPLLIRMLSEKIPDSKYQLLYSPLYIENDIVRQSLIHEQMIRETMDTYQELDVILTSVSYFSKNEKSAWASYISDEEYERLYQLGAKTSFMGHFINSRGEIVSPARDRKQVGITLDEVKQCSNTILLAFGELKAEAAAAAIATGSVNTVIVDSDLAEKMLRLDYRRK